VYSAYKYVRHIVQYGQEPIYGAVKVFQKASTTMLSYFYEEFWRLNRVSKFATMDK